MKLEKIKTINTSDILYDVRLKQFCVYPIGVDLNTFDFDYIYKNCLRLSITSSN